MAQSLGEKLRQAREERGISISEVAEQTRISPLYLKSIEKDDYKPLPGGIFNKGFLRSFARYIGFDEEEALAEYAQLVAENEANPEPEPTHRHQVLVDDPGMPSVVPVVVVGVLILGLIGTGIFFLARYIISSAGSGNSNTAVAAA